jgi:hypothetical protein
MIEFTNILKSEHLLSSEDVSMAIRGIGLFSIPCRKYYSDHEIKQLSSLLVAKSSFYRAEYFPISFLSFLRSEQSYNGHSHSSAFIESFACFINEFDVLDDGFLSVVEKTVNDMLIEFPKFYISIKYANAHSLQSLLWALFRRGLISKVWSTIGIP